MKEIASMNDRTSKHIFLKIALLCVSVCILFIPEASTQQPLVTPVPNSATGTSTPSLLPPNCKSAFLIEASTGDIVYELNADEPLPPASMVKMMTILITMEQIKAGTLHLDDIITVSAFASKIGGSQVYLKENEQFSLEELLKAVVIHSANDAATAIAERIGGNNEGFVHMMNERAAALGLTQTVFRSPHGLPPAADQEADLSTPRELAIIGREIATKHPKVLEWASMNNVGFRNNEFIMANTNKLIGNYPGADGIKTGYYDKAGFCVTASALRNGVRMIAVVMGCEKGKQRFEEAARLMSFGFDQFKQVTLIEKAVPSSANLPVIDGEKVETTPVTAERLAVTIRKKDEANIVRKTMLFKNMTAPISPNVECGSMAFFIGEKEIGRVPLITTELIPALSWWGKLLRMIGLK